MSLPRAFLSRPFAHRGLHDAAAGAIENSAASVDAAIVAGYGIELDVQLSRDGTAMVFHDDRLDRLTARSGRIRDRDARELEGIALRGGGAIPTLPAILGRVAGRVPLLIEMKDPSGRLDGTDGRLEAATAAALSAYDGAAAVMSFNPHMIAALGRRAPDVIRGLTTCAFGADWPLPEGRRAGLRRIADYDRVGAAFVSHDHRDLAAPRIADLKRRGAAILCWTIRDPDAERAALRVADAVTFEGYRPA